MRETPHDRAEALAGAIALGEATDDERLEYRRHLAACGKCLHANGGELELERLSGRIKEAQSSEIWDPDVRGPLMDRVNTGPRSVARYGLGFLGVALVISFIGHFLIGSSFPTRSAIVDPLTLNYDGTKITLERRSVRDQKTPAPARYNVNVSHNIVVLPRPAVAKLPLARPQPDRTRTAVPRQVALEFPPASNAARTQDAATQHPAAASSRPPWQTARRAVAHDPGVLGAGANAESISMNSTYTTREPLPDGGLTAINPQPAQIAYQEGAEGTAAFEVMIDETGAPVKCVITKSSGWPVLDDAACAAAMKVHYRPKTVNGHAVPGIYRDAFTFRAQPNQE